MYLGYELDENALDRASRHCTKLAEQKVDVTDEELLSIIHDSSVGHAPTAPRREPQAVAQGGRSSEG